MTPKDKAEELYITFYERLPDSIYSDYAAKQEAKQSALTVVEEILEVIDKTMQGWVDTDIISYWQEVKQEIQNL